MESVLCKRNECSGRKTSLSLYQIKYLNELYLPYVSFLETKTLLISLSLILKSFFIFVVKVTFFYFFVVKIYAAYTHSYIL